MKKPKLLIIDKEQFGYTTDTYKWCQLIKNDFNITYLSLDHRLPKIKLDGIHTIHTPPYGNKIIRGINFICTALTKILLTKGKIMCIYFPTCGIFKKLLPRKKMHVDVRTLTIHSKADNRKTADEKLRAECRLFDSISAISTGVAQKINLPNIKILPLGSDVISETPVHYTGPMQLLYVGTLHLRNIDRTLQGLRLYLNRHPNAQIHYDIVGDGKDGELDSLKQLTGKLNLNPFVTFHGYKHFTEIKPLYQRANIGICFVPITDYFDHQPPTKTFEYIRAGLYCIATGTTANRELITPENGVIIQDTPQSFCQGLEHFSSHNSEINEYNLRHSLDQYSWTNIVNSKLKPILNDI